MTKLFAFDVDGTLLTSDHRILPSTKEALRLIAAQGHRSILASARPPVGLEPIWRQLGFHLLYISLNGALIGDGEKVLFEQEIPAPGVEQALQLARELGLSINFYAGQRWLIEEENPYSAQEAEIVEAQPELVDLDAISKVHKILVMGCAEKISMYQKRLQAASPLVNASLSKPTYCEIVSREVSKGRALKQVCACLGIGLHQTVAFGDGENDLELAATAGRAIAMGNGHPALLAKADFVSTSNDQDGILAGVQWALSQP